MSTAPSDVLGLSDEDFLKQSSTLENEAEAALTAGKNAQNIGGGDSAAVVEGEKTQAQLDEEAEIAAVAIEGEADDPAAIAAKQADEAAIAADKAAKAEARAAAKAAKKVVETTTDPAVDPNTAAQTTQNEPVQAGPAEYESFFKRVMTPFKANGRTVELKTPEEAIQLMQMGANYTKKMQELVPHRKVLTMLQNNGLMDEGKLSYLIDLDKKNPEAIKKLVKDAGIDPLEIDNSAESTYTAGNHRVSDAEVNFHTTLDDMASTPERVETLKVINGGWDQASKEALFANPQIMTTIHSQRESGIYDRIATEVTRRQTLGQIPTNVPFLQAYKVVGDEIQAQGGFNDLIAKTAQPAVVAPIVTRVATPKSKVTNNHRAAAVSSTRSTPSTARTPSPSDVLNMSDDEFLKQMGGRL